MTELKPGTWDQMRRLPPGVDHQGVVSLVASALASGLGIATDRAHLAKLQLMGMADPRASIVDCLADDARDFVDMRGDLLDELMTKTAAADERAAALVESMCDWTADFGGARTVVEPVHSKWHLGNLCPYEAMAAVLRGQPDPRHPVDVRSCRVCGCTDDDCSACIEATGQPCSWVAADLCSRCSVLEL